MTDPKFIDLTEPASDPPEVITDEQAADPEALWGLLTSMTRDNWPALQPGRMDAAISFLAERHGWDGDGTGEFARLTGTNDRTVRRWLAGTHYSISGEVLFLLLGMLRNQDLAGDLRDSFTPSGLLVSESMDRMLFAFRRDPSLLRQLRLAR